MEQAGVPRVLDRGNLLEKRFKTTRIVVRTQVASQGKPMHWDNETPDIIYYVDVTNVAHSGLLLVINNII